MSDEFLVRATVGGHTGPITDLAWHPKGEVFATASKDGTFRVLEPPRGRETDATVRSTGKHDDEVLTLAFSPDGTLLATGGRDCRIRCWNWQTGTLINTFFGPSSFRSVVWSPDSQRIAAVQTNTIHVFGRDRDQQTEDYLDGHQRIVRRVVWLPDDTLLSGDEDGRLIRWSLVPRKAVRTAELGVGLADFGYANGNIALACKDGVAQLWSVNPLRPVGELPIGDGALRQAVFFRGDQYIASIGTTGWVRLHERQTRALNREFQPPPAVHRIAAHPARSFLIAAVDREALLVEVPVSAASRVPRSRPPSAAPPLPPTPIPTTPIRATPISATPIPATPIPATPIPATPIPATPIPTASAPSPPTLKQTGTMQILFMAANPSEHTRLRLGAESTQIKEALALSTQRERFQFLEEHAIRLDALQRVLMQRKPDIVHFSGHGASNGSLVFEDDTGQGVEAPPEPLARAFKLARTIRVVVLNACYSRKQAELLARFVDVVGMNTAIPDASAIAFSKSFYETLGEGADLQDAFESAKNYLDLNNLPGSDIPELLPRAPA